MKETNLIIKLGDSEVCDKTNRYKLCSIEISAKKIMPVLMFKIDRPGYFIKLQVR